MPAPEDGSNMNPAEAFRQRWRNRDLSAMISVHRGLWNPAPENSLASIAAAAPFGIIEIDAQMTADGVPVVVHDPDLKRTAGVNLIPQQTDHAILTAQRLRAGFGGPEADWSDQFIPTLEQALKAVGSEAYFDIDVKNPNEVDAVASALAHQGLGDKGSLKIATRAASDIEALLALQERSGAMVMAKVTLPDAGLDHIKALVDAGVGAVELWFDDLDQLAQACTLAGDDMAISTYTLDPVHCCGISDAKALQDPDQTWGRLLDAGISIIMTDQAVALQRYLTQRA
ncbi:MAG: glycerophosphodiester phosphodiesterase family protein [Paracoccaceae bacterium]